MNVMPHHQELLVYVQFRKRLGGGFVALSINLDPMLGPRIHRLWTLVQRHGPEFLLSPRLGEGIDENPAKPTSKLAFRAGVTFADLLDSTLDCRLKNVVVTVAQVAIMPHLMQERRVEVRHIALYEVVNRFVITSTCFGETTAKVEPRREDGSHGASHRGNFLIRADATGDMMGR
jgi:hypothetical protein